jgi:hypothetical protein
MKGVKMKHFFVILIVVAVGAALFLTQGNRVFADAPIEGPTAQPTANLPTLKLGTMPVSQAMALFQSDIDKLNTEVAALQAQNEKLLAQNVQLQAQVVAQNALVQAQITTIQQSLQPTPRPPGALLPGAVSWYSLKNGGSRYDNYLIQVLQNPSQQMQTPGGGEPTLEQRSEERSARSRTPAN